MIASSYPVAPAPMSLRGCHRSVASVMPALADSPFASDLRRWLGHQASRYSDLLQNIEAAHRRRRTSLNASREPSHPYRRRYRPDHLVSTLLQHRPSDPAAACRPRQPGQPFAVRLPR